MKVRIQSDGTWRGTQVIDVATGEALENVKALQLSVVAGEKPVAVLEFLDVEVDMVAEREEKE